MWLEQSDFEYGAKVRLGSSLCRACYYADHPFLISQALKEICRRINEGELSFK